MSQQNHLTAGDAPDLRRGILDDFDRFMQHVMQWRLLDISDVDVTMPQARCLMLVGIRPSLPISALAGQLHVSMPAASGLVERLVEHGYVERNTDPDDRRHQLVTLTERGGQLVERLHELSTDKLGDLIRDLSLDELAGLRLGVAALEREARKVVATPSEPPKPERNPA